MRRALKTHPVIVIDVEISPASFFSPGWLAGCLPADAFHLEPSGDLRYPPLVSGLIGRFSNQGGFSN